MLYINEGLETIIFNGTSEDWMRALANGHLNLARKYGKSLKVVCSDKTLTYKNLLNIKVILSKVAEKQQVRF